MPKFERPFESLEEFHGTELEEFKLMFETGAQIAVTAAMDYCVRHGLNPPHWAMTESVKAQCAELCGDMRQEKVAGQMAWSAGTGRTELTSSVGIRCMKCAITGRFFATQSNRLRNHVTPTRMNPVLIAKILYVGLGKTRLNAHRCC